MTPQVTVTGQEQIARNLLAKAQGILNARWRAAQQIAQLLQAYTVTHTEWKDVTGNLRASIHGAARLAANDIVEAVLSAGSTSETGEPYGYFLEYGHEQGFMRYSKDYAYMRPAIKANIPAIIDIIRTEMAAA